MAENSTTDSNTTDSNAVAGAVPVAARELLGVLARIGDADTSRPTPCADFTVADLLEHLRYWGPGLLAASPAGADTADTGNTADTGGLAALVERLGAAWSDPASWEGNGSIAGTELPRSVLGRMVFVEFVLHAWDLAAAVNPGGGWRSSVAAPAVDVLSGLVAQGRRMGAFGPEVEVPASAPEMDRALGLAGRDPAWRP
ncbi:TIGR03086 family metal-binding protein [Prauserella halophila]|uniref:TIGR03086 family metal-binding protein n=1 Tax=Prauserella halophila TaxID=185641 RepID=A0ABP4GX34_9PSEU|nr:TIGR03086 family metal-binding protein [Prauserella halophila]